MLGEMCHVLYVYDRHKTTFMTNQPKPLNKNVSAQNDTA